MTLHDYLNVRRVLGTLAAELNCPVWVVRVTIRRTIALSWEKSQLMPGEKPLWEKYFPKGKPTPEQYILRLGRAYEAGEGRPVF